MLTRHLRFFRSRFVPIALHRNVLEVAPSRPSIQPDRSRSVSPMLRALCNRTSMNGGAGVPGLALTAILNLAAASPVAGQEAALYSIKSSDVVVPEGVALGSYRRVIHPFENWNLICDENLQARKKVCNISQAFIDRNQAVVFSWSLAADESGKPFMILRAPAQLGSGSKVSLIVPGREKPVDVQVEACDASVCIGYVPVGPILREQISKEITVQVTYSMPNGTMVSLDAPFKGLNTALSAIN